MPLSLQESSTPRLKIDNVMDATFFNKVIEVSEKLEIDPSWLLDVMRFESNLNPQAVNRITGATGLIQFMPDTAKALGTTTTALYDMTAVQQMDYVYRYLLPYKGKMDRLIDVYFAVFFPAAIGKPRDWVLRTSGMSAGLIASQNGIFDTVRDNQITVGEVEDYLHHWLGYKKKTK